MQLPTRKYARPRAIHRALLPTPFCRLSRPYFVRFLTTPAGQDLASIQTRRIAECSDAYARGQPQERIGEACQFAATLLVLQGHDSIPTETRTAAISRLEQWKRQHRRTFAEEAADRCLGSLRSPGNFGRYADPFEKSFVRPLLRRGFPVLRTHINI